MIQTLASIFHNNCLSSSIYVQFGALKPFLWDQVKLKTIKTWSISKGCLSLDSNYLPLLGQCGKDKMLGRVKYSDVCKKSHIITEIYFGDCVASLLSCPNISHYPFSPALNISHYLTFASAALIFSTNQCTKQWAWNPGLARESRKRFCFAFSVNIIHILMINIDICFCDTNLRRTLESG